MTDPVIRGVRFFLAHTPGLVRYGSKPGRDIAQDAAVLDAIERHLRSWDDAAAYPPNHAFLGGLQPEDLRRIPRPWCESPQAVVRRHPHGELMPEDEFYGLLKVADQFGLVRLEEGFARDVSAALAKDPDVRDLEAAAAGKGEPLPSIEAEVGADVATGRAALGLHLRSGRLVGCIRRGHEEDPALSADVLLENLACKVTAAMAARAAAT